MKLFNTDSKSIQDFKPISDTVKVYCCGPTVYNFAHIGNLRTYINEDILVKSLRYLGFDVYHVMNITDVGHLTDDSDYGEDKLILASKQTGQSVLDIAKKYEDAFMQDIKHLNIATPNVVSRATDNIDKIIEFISSLENKGFTYSSGGNIYFDTSKCDYDKIFENKSDNNLNRVDLDKYKKNPKDFVVWFTNSKFENHILKWDSPFGKGYPGWHIECSAISKRFLGDSFDIHCGGVDHISIHHKNERAQSQSANGCQMAKYWVHSEFLVLDKSKMSKSGGNFITLKTLQDEGFSPMAYRYFCLTSHYRKQLKFSYENLKSAQTGYNNLISTISQIEDDSQINENGQKYIKDFKDAISEDLNTSKALAVLFEMVKDKEVCGKIEIIKNFDLVLSLSLIDNSQSLKQTKSNQEIPQQVLVLSQRRKVAKENRDYQNSDNLRKEIEKLGYSIKDTPLGYDIVKII